MLSIHFSVEWYSSSFCANLPSFCVFASTNEVVEARHTRKMQPTMKKESWFDILKFIFFVDSRPMMTVLWSTARSSLWQCLKLCSQPKQITPNVLVDSTDCNCTFSSFVVSDYVQSLFLVTGTLVLSAFTLRQRQSLSRMALSIYDTLNVIVLLLVRVGALRLTATTGYQ